MRHELQQAAISGYRRRPTPVTHVRGSLCAVAALLLSGCVTSQTTPYFADESGFYTGEPVVLHATEMPVSSAEEARQRARSALAKRDVDLALYFHVQAANMDPENPESFYVIGAIHAELNNPEFAVRAYRRVIELEPDSALAHQGLGLALFEMRDFDLAAVHLQSAADLDPTLWRPYNTLGIIADRSERYDDAIAFYSEAIKIQPRMASIRNNRGYSRYLAGDFDAARLDFLEAIEIDAEYDRAWRNLGLVFARDQDFERALLAMANAIPRHIALNDIGYVAMLDGNFGAARKFFEDAILESPRHYQVAQDNLAELNRRSAPRPTLFATE